MQLIDTHCHLDFPDFADELESVIARAEKAGVSRMVSICTKLEDFIHVKKIAQSYDPVFCTIGVHPHEAERYPSLQLSDLTAPIDEKVIGLGETGLDNHYNHSSQEAQERSLRIHIEAARLTGLPLIIHSRSADEQTARILTEEYQNGAFTGLLHCFSAGKALAEAALNIGFYISFSGILTFKNAENVREVARFCPSDRLLVETDAPYLAPAPHRGKRNEPSFVLHTAERLAEIRGEEGEEIGRLTSQNARNLFQKMS